MQGDMCVCLSACLPACLPGGRDVAIFTKIMASMSLHCAYIKCDVMCVCGVCVVGVIPLFGL